LGVRLSINKTNLKRRSIQDCWIHNSGASNYQLSAKS
jgi:hypothetical protein